MKILILQSKLTDTDTVRKGLKIAQDKCATIGLALDYTIKTTDRNFTSIPFSNNVNNTGYIVNPNEIASLESQYGNFDVIVLVYDPSSIYPQPTNPADNGEVIQLPSTWYVSFPEVFAEFILHEIAHFMFWWANLQIEKENNMLK